MQLFVENLTNSDFCFLHPTRGLLGETWLSHIQLEGELDEQGMICDFGMVKSLVRQLLDDEIDHRLLAPTRAENISIERNTSSVDIHWRLEGDSGALLHKSPPQCVTLIDADSITPDSVARWCETELKTLLPETVHAVRVSLTSETITSAYYHYSHGLKKHDGKCQRIAHGHRSKIEIQRNGARDQSLEQTWAAKLRDSYIGTREDVATQDAEQVHFRYRAQEGDFELSLPKAQCYLIDSDSTVENIAQHIANMLKAEDPMSSFTVKAYEGLSKGAVVRI